MRSSFALALAASSLLVKDALAMPLRPRAVVTDEVLVTDEVTVVQDPDGSFATGAAVPVATTTIDGVAVVISSTVPPTTPPATTPTVAPPKKNVEPAAPPAAAPPAPASPAPAPASPAPAPASPAPAPPASPAPAPTTTQAPPPPPPPATTSAAPSPSSSSVSTPSPPSSAAPIPSGTGSSAKRGVAYNDASLLPAFVGSGSQASWCYNWGATSGGEVPSSLEYVPMLWGASSTFTQGWHDAASSAIKAGASNLLSFNEPDLSSQANLSPSAAAAAYHQYLDPFAGQARLGAPATTNGAASQGMGNGWLSSFLDACDSLGCTVDFVPTHWYSAASDVDDFKSHVEGAHAAGGNRPVWVTEFAATGSADEQQTFLEAVIPWLDAQDYVERYAYFMASDGSLVSGNALSPLGQTYTFSN